ncbi:hypothetical protein [Paenibacillus sp. DYY-L-2]|uniref:hypothetical protein n=1 Tax=Paenibacillus sp. DYY-L-2 TaxID=3447013 RepID=UPI003F509A52
MKKSLIFIIGLLFVSLSLSGCTDKTPGENKVADTAEVTDENKKTENSEQSDAVVYENTDYGFRFSLPDTWKGYTVIMEKWEGTPFEGSQDSKIEEGPKISLRHPDWTADQPMQDIPILILTIAQWDALQAESFHIGAAPVGPKELGRNDKYVFALPARYNFAFPKGYEEVEDILSTNPLTPINQH